MPSISEYINFSLDLVKQNFETEKIVVIIACDWKKQIWLHVSSRPTESACSPRNVTAEASFPCENQENSTLPPPPVRVDLTVCQGPQNNFRIHLEIAIWEGDPNPELLAVDHIIASLDRISMLWQLRFDDIEESLVGLDQLLRIAFLTINPLKPAEWFSWHQNKDRALSWWT